MSLETRIGKVEAKADPKDKYPYEISVRFIDHEEAVELARKQGLPEHTAVFVTYGDEK